MCSIGYHNCPTCSEEYKCNQPNSECPIINHYDGPCQKCEHWIDEERRERDKEDRIKWERDEWIRENGWDY